MILRFLVVATLMAVVASGCASEPSRSPTATPSGTPGSQATATAVPAMTPSPQAGVTVSLLLDVQAPAEEVVVTQPSVEVRGKTVLDAVVTINGEVVPVDASGEFSADVELEPGPNSITIVASDFQGSEQARVLTVIYVP